MVVEPAHQLVLLPKEVLAAVRQRFPRLRLIYCKMTWDTTGNVQFDKGPLFEIQPDDTAWVIEQEGEYLQPIVVEQSVLRQFLLDTGTRVTLYWKRKGKRYFQLDHGRLTACFRQHDSAGHSNRCSRARTRDTD